MALLGLYLAQTPDTPAQTVINYYDAMNSGDTQKAREQFASIEQLEKYKILS